MWKWLWPESLYAKSLGGNCLIALALVINGVVRGLWGDVELFGFLFVCCFAMRELIIRTWRAKPDADER